MNDFLNFFVDGVADSSVLSVLVLIDTTLAVSYWFKNGRRILSNTLLSGLLRNVVLALMPSLMQLLSTWHPNSTSSIIYPLVTSIITIHIGFAIVQSIMAYTAMWGINFPSWLEAIIKQEIRSKIGVKIDKTKDIKIDDDQGTTDKK